MNLKQHGALSEMWFPAETSWYPVKMDYYTVICVLVESQLAHTSSTSWTWHWSSWLYCQEPASEDVAEAEAPAGEQAAADEMCLGYSWGEKHVKHRYTQDDGGASHVMVGCAWIGWETRFANEDDLDICFAQPSCGSAPTIKPSFEGSWSRSDRGGRSSCGRGMYIDSDVFLFPFFQHKVFVFFEVHWTYRKKLLLDFYFLLFLSFIMSRSTLWVLRFVLGRICTFYYTVWCVGKTSTNSTWHLTA